MLNYHELSRAEEFDTALQRRIDWRHGGRALVIGTFRGLFGKFIVEAWD